MNSGCPWNQIRTIVFGKSVNSYLWERTFVNLLRFVCFRNCMVVLIFSSIFNFKYGYFWAISDHYIIIKVQLNRYATISKAPTCCGFEDGMSATCCGFKSTSHLIVLQHFITATEIQGHTEDAMNWTTDCHKMKYNCSLKLWWSRSQQICKIYTVQNVSVGL